MFCFRGGMGAGSLDCAMWLCLGKGFGGMERRVGDPELGAPLVVAGDVVDDLNAVVRYVGFESGGGCPDESAAVGGGVDDAADYEGFDVSVEPSNQRIGKISLTWEDVSGRSAQKDDGDRAGAGWLPGYAERSTSWDRLIEAGWRGFVLVLLLCNNWKSERDGKKSLHSFLSVLS